MKIWYLSIIVLLKNFLEGVDGRYGDWSNWSSCTQSCGGGFQRRTRVCNTIASSRNETSCTGPSYETRGCSNNFCKGPSGVARALEIVKESLENLHKTKFPDKKPSGKFYKSVFAIQAEVAGEFISVDPKVRKKTFQERLKELEEFMKVAAEGKSTEFSRRAFGKGLFTLMKQKIAERFPIDRMDKAAAKYLDELRKNVTNKTMDEILSAKGDSTLIFVIDTTGSMHDEINAAKAIAKQIINVTRDHEVDYILSPFNDPSTGPVIYRSESQRSTFLSDIDGLPAIGGGDCPELAFTGMINAFDEGPKYGSPMFVFTDASAKDATLSNIADLQGAAHSNGVTITFFANLRGCSSSGIKDYRNIARDTNGLVFPLYSDAELIQFAKLVNVSFNRDATLTAGGTAIGRTIRSTSFSHSFAVDDGISKIIVSIVVSNRNTTSQVSLVDPANVKVNPLITTSLAIVFEKESPKAGQYKLTFPITVGKYEYNVQGASEGAIEFAYSFIYQQSVRKNSPPIYMKNPFKGIKNMIVVHLGGENRIDLSSIRIDIVDIKGKVLQANIVTDGLGTDEIRNATIIPPAKPFKVKLRGKTKSGFDFERISDGVTNATTLFLRPIFAGYDFTAQIGNTTVRVQVQCINKGPRESIQFQAAAVYGSVPNSNQTKTIRSTAFIGFDYAPPSSTTFKGKTDRVTVIAKRSVTNEIYTQKIPILLLAQV